MDKALREKAIRYRGSFSVLREMIFKGIITQKDLMTLATKIAEKSGLSSSTIFCDIDLLYSKDNGNM